MKLESPTILTHSKPRITGRLGLVNRDDRLWAGKYFLVLFRETTLRQLPVTELVC